MVPSDDHTPAWPIACDLSAIAVEDRAAHLARARALVFETFSERRELPDGFAWRFPASQYDDVAAYVANERRCCPFFTFTIDVTPHAGPVWLRLTGDAAVKAYLESELATNGVV